MLIRITAAVLTCCALMSCVDDSAVVTELDWAETVMEAHPDSALALLDTLDRNRLRTRGAKARHALLYSQALDKNWIDLSTDSIIKPAVRYYARHGSPDDRLKSRRSTTSDGYTRMPVTMKARCAASSMPRNMHQNVTMPGWPADCTRP